MFFLRETKETGKQIAGLPAFVGNESNWSVSPAVSLDLNRETNLLGLSINVRTVAACLH